MTETFKLSLAKDCNIDLLDLCRPVGSNLGLKFGRERSRVLTVCVSVNAVMKGLQNACRRSAQMIQIYFCYKYYNLNNLYDNLDLV